MSKINVVIADAQQIFIEGLSLVLGNLKGYDLEVVGSSNNFEKLIDLLESKDVDIVFSDIHLPGSEDYAHIRKVRDHYAEIHICVLSSYTDSKFVKDAMKSGADAYYSKFSGSGELELCIEHLILGKTFLSDGLYITPPQRKLNNYTNGFGKVHEDRFIIKQKLTKREHEVLSFITKALNNKEIAEKLYISHQTVGVHRKNIMRKLGVRNTVNLIKFAMDHHLV